MLATLVFYTAVKHHLYYVCCRDGHYHGNDKPRVTNQTRPHQKASRKLDATCLSRLYIDELYNGSVAVTYIPVHTGHKPGPREQRFLPLPASIQEEVSSKLSLGVPTKRVLQGKSNLLIKADKKIKHSEAYPL